MEMTSLSLKGCEEYFAKCQGLKDDRKPSHGLPASGCGVETENSSLAGLFSGVPYPVISAVCSFVEYPS